MYFQQLFSAIGGLLDSFLAWLFSERSGGIMTLFTGYIAYKIFIWQQNKVKEDAAKTIYIEILDIEKNVAEILPHVSSHSHYLDKYIIHKNSWSKYSHLFAMDFSQRELEMFNEFYASAETAQKLIDDNRKIMDVAMEEKARQFQQKIADQAVAMAKKGATALTSSIDASNQEWVKLYQNDNYWFLPFTYKTRLTGLLSRIPILTSTVAGGKLAEIANINKKPRFLERMKSKIF